MYSKLMAMIKEVVYAKAFTGVEQLDKGNFSLFLYTFSFDPNAPCVKNNAGMPIKNPYREMAKITLLNYACEEYMNSSLRYLQKKNHPKLKLIESKLKEVDEPPIDVVTHQEYYENVYNEALKEYEEDRSTHLDMAFLQQLYMKEEFHYASLLG